MVFISPCNDVDVSSCIGDRIPIQRPSPLHELTSRTTALSRSLMQEKPRRSHAGKAAAVLCRKSWGGLMQEKLRRSHAGKAAAVSCRKSCGGLMQEKLRRSQAGKQPTPPPPTQATITVTRLRPSCPPHPPLLPLRLTLSSCGGPMQEKRLGWGGKAGWRVADGRRDVRAAGPRRRFDLLAQQGYYYY